ncbi:MAG: AAA family ATPase [Nanoarchaeota archaeon]|nr:AAA family ATPase [Nanoarchaeota archaeon]
MYKKILIVGPSGSGKTTLARRIGKILKIESKSIDELRYSKDFLIKFSDKKAKNNLSRFLRRKRWILDGVYAREYIYPAFRKADIVIGLKASRLKLIYRIIKRDMKERKKYKNKPIKDFFKLLYWSQRYKYHNEIKHQELIKKFKKRAIYLKNNKEIESFIKAISN